MGKKSGNPDRVCKKGSLSHTQLSSGTRGLLYGRSHNLLLTTVETLIGFVRKVLYHIHSYLVGLEVYFMVGVIIYFLILCMQAAEALVLISYTWAKVLKLKNCMIERGVEIPCWTCPTCPISFRTT